MTSAGLICSWHTTVGLGLSEMTLGAVGLALATVVLFVASLVALEWVWSWWDARRYASKLRRYIEIRDQAEAKWSDPPNSAGRD